MNGIVLRWGVPALVTVVGGTALAISATSAGMVDDLGVRATVALTNEQYGWASVSFEARDAVLTGTASSQEVIDAALAEVAQIHGVRSVRSAVILAEHVSPFPFAASVKDGAIALSGGVPDERAHAEILLETGATRDDLRLLSGAPSRGPWRAAVEYGLAHLQHFDAGEFELSDLEISINGRAKSVDAYEALVNFGPDSAPPGVTVAQREILPPLASPYEWHAVFDGTTIAVSGHAPNEAFAERLQAGGFAGIPVATSLVLASGEPEGFEATAMRLLENLARLEEGRADISDDAATFAGAPPDEATADAVRLALTPLGADVSLEPARVEAYRFAATRSGNSTVLEGYVPDAATRDRLAARANVDVAGLGLARGAPGRFDSGVEFGLDLLERLSDGRFVLTNTTLAIEGRAATAADYDAIRTTLALGAPQGLILRSSDIYPPLADPFVWSVEKRDGSLRMAGFVPSDEIRATLRAAVPGLERDETAIADGEPPDFETEALAALGLLPRLKAASIEYAGNAWSLTGTVETLQQASAVEAAFVEAGLRAAGWSLALELDRVADEPPLASPYAWAATKAADGRVSLTGYVTTEELRRFLALRAGTVESDATEIAAGEPAGFATYALAGVEALGHLESGTVMFEDGVWSIAGVPRTAEDAERAVAVLGETTSGGADWRTELSAPRAPTEAPPPAEETEPGSDAPLEPPAIAPDATEPEPNAAEPAEEAAPVRDFVFAARKDFGGNIELTGSVPADAARRFFGVIAGGVPTDRMSISTALPDDFIANADAGIRMLGTLAAGQFGLDGTTWVLEGRVENETARRAAIEALAAVPAAADWQADITLLAPVDVCRQHIAAFAARNAILFRSGSALLTEESFTAIDELAVYLDECPDTVVHVEGHTDSDGPDDLNLALSVARAEAVVEALIERGVSYHRLYAVGYGESLPVADNNTVAGKSANRRIAFTVLEQHQ